MPHLIKLAVGARTVEDIERWQAGRTSGDAPATVPTRQFPKRAGEIVASGGSLYWVISGTIAARQEIAAIDEVTDPDGTRSTAIRVRRPLIHVTPRPQRPFQGWRYLERGAAPPDLALATGGDDTVLPARLARELAALCLL